MAADNPAGSDSTSRVVAIYRTQILPLSETFVRDQALALARWRPVLVGERAIGALPLGNLAVSTLYSGRPTLTQRVSGLAFRRLDLPRPGMCGLVRQVRPLLIHAHFGFDGVEAWPVARRLGLKLLVTLHGSDVTTRMGWFASGRAGRRWKHYPARLARLAQQEQVSFAAVSENIRQAAIANGLPPRRIHVQRIGIDTTQFQRTGRPIAERGKVILFLGRLVEKKGARILIDAFGRLRASLPDAELVIAGDGPERPALEAQAAGLPSVRFVGAFLRPQAQALLGEARVFCLPSVTADSGDAEGLPLVILEAQASGVPVVTSARGGATEGILNGRTGFAFAEHDVAALTAHLIRVLTDDDLASAMSAAGPAYVATQHDLAGNTAALERLYDRVAGLAP